MQLLDSCQCAGSAWRSCICLCPFVFQRAGRASTSPRSGTWSVQSVRLTAFPTMRGRCTAAVRRTTSVPRETLHPWRVPVSVQACTLCVILVQVFWVLGYTRSQWRPRTMTSAACYFSIRYLTRGILLFGEGGFFSLAHKASSETCLNPNELLIHLHSKCFQMLFYYYVLFGKYCPCDKLKHYRVLHAYR